MAKVIFEFDPSLGAVTGSNGMVAYMMGILPFEEIKDQSNNTSSGVDDIIKLKNAGFTADEIIAIRKSALDK